MRIEKIQHLDNIGKHRPRLPTGRYPVRIFHPVEVPPMQILITLIELRHDDLLFDVDIRKQPLPAAPAAKVRPDQLAESQHADVPLNFLCQWCGKIFMGRKIRHENSPCICLLHTFNAGCHKSRKVGRRSNPPLAQQFRQQVLRVLINLQKTGV